MPTQPGPLFTQLAVSIAEMHVRPQVKLGYRKTCLGSETVGQPVELMVLCVESSMHTVFTC